MTLNIEKSLDLPLVEYWTTPAPGNAENRHARCQGIEFVALPRQTYYGRLGDHYVVVGEQSSRVLDARGWRQRDFYLAVVYRDDEKTGQSGRGMWVSSIELDTADEVFRWVSSLLLAKQQQETSDVPNANS